MKIQILFLTGLLLALNSCQGQEKKDSKIVGETLNLFNLIGEEDDIKTTAPLEKDHSGARVGHLYITNY